MYMTALYGYTKVVGADDAQSQDLRDAVRALDSAIEDDVSGIANELPGA